MAYGRHFEKKNVKCYISAAVQAILMKFGTTKFCIMTHISPPELTSCSKIQILKIKDGGRPQF